MLIVGIFANQQIAHADYNFGKWLNFGTDRDSTDFSISLDNQAPNAPTLVSPDNSSWTSDTTPELSANYTDPDADDTGTTNYRIALSALGCINANTIVSSGTSSTTTTNSEATTWSSASAISDGAYYWCARNNDGELTSVWTSIGSFSIDTTAPSTPSISYTDGYLGTASQDITFSATDAESGIASYTLYYKSATLTTSCGTYTGWISLDTQTSPYSHSLITAKCYKYKVSATNSVDLTNSKDDATEITKVDTATPDIVAIDSGASNADRVSLTSETFFKASSIGSDDKVSFSWTDPSSLSDDTFYYELNTTATATITGDESTVATNYIDNITITEGTSYFHVRPKTGASNWGTERIFILKYDKTAPNIETDTLTSPNGSEIWTGGDSATYEITWTTTDITDTNLADNPITLEYSLDSGTGWTSIATGEANDGTYTWTTLDASDSEMRIRITATDQAGNTSNDSSDSDFRLSAHDNWIALHITAGNNQSAGISASLSTALQARVGNGATSGETFAGAGDITVSFALGSVPSSPTAVGQSLSTASDDTDADGYASTIITLGDRAGDYTVIANFSGTETSLADRTFTTTEREVFKFTISDSDLDIDVDPITNTSATQSTTLTVTTNAASYQININPNQWPTYEAESIPNWTGSEGIAWDNNNAGTSGGVSAATAFTGLDTATDAYICSGDTCQGANEFTLDFHATIDADYEAGVYQNVLTVEGGSINF
jgi:hypothetical protein